MHPARMLGIRPGEVRLVALVAALFATIEAGRGFGEIGVDMLVLRRSGASVAAALLGPGETARAAARGAAMSLDEALDRVFEYLDAASASQPLPGPTTGGRPQG